jgi:hypothetical protein
MSDNINTLFLTLALLLTLTLILIQTRTLPLTISFRPNAMIDPSLPPWKFGFGFGIGLGLGLGLGLGVRVWVRVPGDAMGIAAPERLPAIPRRRVRVKVRVKG